MVAITLHFTIFFSLLEKCLHNISHTLFVSVDFCWASGFHCSQEHKYWNLQLTTIFFVWISWGDCKSYGECLSWDRTFWAVVRRPTSSWQLRTSEAIAYISVQAALHKRSKRCKKFEIKSEREGERTNRCCKLNFLIIIYRWMVNE